MAAKTEERAPLLIFTEADSAYAHREWGFNCGPAALAAALEMTPDEVRPYLGEFETRHYMNPTMMRSALVAIGVRFKAVDSFPDHGLARVQWCGPWLDAGVPPSAAYSRTHWIASSWQGPKTGAWIYDVNGGWVTLGRWVAEIVPAILAEIPRNNGHWYLTHCWEIR